MPSLRSMENAQIGAAKREKKYPLMRGRIPEKLSLRPGQEVA